MKRTHVLATALIVAAGGLATNAYAARFVLSNGTTLYTGTLGSNGAMSATIGVAAGSLGDAPALGFDSTGRLFGAFRTGGLTDIREITGWDSSSTFDPMAGAVIGTTDSQTNSFDFRGRGSNERMIGTRNRTDPGAGPVYFESTDSSYSSFVDVDAGGTGTGFGASSSYPSSGYDRNTGTYWAITAGNDGDGVSNRNILTIDITTGTATDTDLNLTFAAGVDYGDIVLAGGDFSESTNTYFLSFFSVALDMAVIGSVDLTNGLFTELSTFSLVGGNQGTMGLAVVIPTPLAGGMGAAGLLLVGARRRRNG